MARNFLVFIPDYMKNLLTPRLMLIKINFFESHFLGYSTLYFKMVSEF